MKYADMPLSTYPLSRDEAMQLQDHLDPLLRFLGRPGDWGYQTKLGRLTQVLSGLRADVVAEKEQAGGC